MFFPWAETTIVFIYGIFAKVAQTDFHYLVLARNEREEVKLADENVGMTVQNVRGSTGHVN